MSDSDTEYEDQQRFKTDDADSYNAVVDHFDRYTQRFTAHLVDPILALAEIPANGTVLDVGTGTGVMALALARNIGRRGKVAGIDLSDGMLAKARQKALLEGLKDQTEFLKMDAENLEFAQDSIDAAVSLYALHHFPNPGKALSEMYRVLKPGANVVIAVGSSPALLSLGGLRAVLKKPGSIWRRLRGRELSACGFMDGLVEKHIPAGSARDVTEWADRPHGFTGSVMNLVRKAGFTHIRNGWTGQYSVVDNVDDFWFLQLTFSSTARKRIQQADAETLERLKTEFYSCCDRVLRQNGRLVYQTGAAIVAGIKPAK